MTLLIDASAVLAVVLNEPEKSSIISAASGFELLAPNIISCEIGNALSGLRRRRLLSSAEVLRCYHLFECLRMPTIAINVCSALALSNKYDIYAYDAYYLEAAFRMQLPLLSLDKK